MEQIFYHKASYLGMESTYRKNLHVRTGKTLEEWVELTRDEGPVTESERRSWLKERGLTTNYAWWVAEYATSEGALTDDPAALVDAMYSKKPTLRPLHDELVRLGLSLGEDVRACPCQTMVPLYRKHVFAQIKPSTKTRIDLGLALGDTPYTERLLDTGGRAKKDRITHRIALSCCEEIDDQVRALLNTAFELDGAPKTTQNSREKRASGETQILLPNDLALALTANPEAQKCWEQLPPSHQREHLEAILEAKKPQTRTRRISKTLEMLLQKPQK